MADVSCLEVAKAFFTTAVKNNDIVEDLGNDCLCFLRCGITWEGRKVHVYASSSYQIESELDELTDCLFRNLDSKITVVGIVIFTCAGIIIKCVAWIRHPELIAHTRRYLELLKTEKFSAVTITQGQLISVKDPRYKKNGCNANDFLSNLPNELVKLVFSFCNQTSRTHLCAASSLFYVIGNQFEIEENDKINKADLMAHFPYFLINTLGLQTLMKAPRKKLAAHLVMSKPPLTKLMIQTAGRAATYNTLEFLHPQDFPAKISWGTQPIPFIVISTDANSLTIISKIKKCLNLPNSPIKTKTLTCVYKLEDEWEMTLGKHKATQLTQNAFEDIIKNILNHRDHREHREERKRENEGLRPLGMENETPSMLY